MSKRDITKLTEQQRKALVLLTSGSGMTYQQIADEVGCNRKTLYAWRTEPQYATFQEEMKKLNDERWLATVDAARAGALKLCMNGNQKMIEFILRNDGLNPTQKVEADLDVSQQVVIIDDM